MKKLESLRLEIISKHERGLSQKDIAAQTGVQQSTISRLIQGAGGTSAENFLKLASWLGWDIIEKPHEQDTARDVCFVDAKIVPAGQGQRPPDVEDYMAVPVVAEVGAGPGLVPQDEMRSWFLVYKHQEAVRYRRNLIAVEIDRDSTSMVPTLKPRDIVLVDRDDRDVSKPGHIMLVMDRYDGSMIKRVSVEKIEGKKDFQIMFYSDNAKENPPILFSLNKDFDGDWDKAIVGRVVWAWSDVSGK